MKKVILVDGNNLLFRSYYATAYTGNILRNSKGFPTNALYGFINMLNKIIKDENPSYMMVAFDKGKTFRHEKYHEYKDGRKETPKELKEQFPIAKKITEAMGIKYFEIDNYEADDIIGTFAKEVDINDEFIATIISSDKDLLQLISKDVDVKLLKTNDYIMMNEKTFFDTYGLTPEKMVDIKALMGDASDNIPGVKGIGEKTALNLLQQYQTIENLYDHIEEIKGKTKEKLITDKGNAFFSKELATIYKDVPIDKELENIKYSGITNDLVPLLEEYEFFSILKKMNIKQEPKEEKPLEYKIINSLEETNIKETYAIYLTINGSYHDKSIHGLALYNKNNAYYIEFKNITNNKLFTNNIKKITYDLKKILVTFKYFNLEIDKSNDDLMLMLYLLNYNLKDDISYQMSINEIDVLSDEELFKNKLSLEEIAKNSILKAKYIYENYEKMIKNLNEENMFSLYNDLELPTSYVLADMEYTGVYVKREILEEMKKEILEKTNKLSKEIYSLAGLEFNILSPKQLGKVLFEKLSLPYPKKVKDANFSTSIDILNKLLDYDIVKKVLEYRTLSKLYSNYAVGLLEFIKEDGKIHTTFNQTLTRTGRLSSTSPNLQNIPVREDYGRLIRKAFVPSENSYILSSDYSQIELRIFAHMSQASNLIEAFNNGLDIHTKTAMDIYHIPYDEVTKKQRRDAKAVNFGILYGISSFGLAEDLQINVKDAKKFIDHYLETFPGIKDYMDSVIKKAYELGYVKTLFGRKRNIEELKNTNYMIRSSGERMALNTPIQGTSADILKKAMIEIYNRFNTLNLKSKMIIQVHDELLFDVRKEELEIVTEIVKEIMEQTYTLSVPLKVEINKGENWYEAK